MNEERVKEEFIRLLPGWMHDNEKRKLRKDIDRGDSFSVIWHAAVKAGYDEGVRVTLQMIDRAVDAHTNR